MATPVFPRDLVPFEVSALEMPGPLISKAQSGRVNLRSTQQIGRTWSEKYLVNTRSVNGRALLAAVDTLWRNGTIFVIDHRDHLTPLGAGGGSPLVNASASLVTNPENLGAWTITGAINRTSGQSDPFGGTAAYLLDSNTPSASDAIFELETFTGDGTKAIAIYLRTFSGSPIQVALWDDTAASFYHRVTVSWLGSLELNTVVTANGSGTIFTPEAWPDRWYRIAFSANSVVAAHTNRIYIYPDSSGAGSACYAFGVNAWNASVPAGYVGPSHPTATGDRLYIDGATASVSSWLRAGDLLSIAGVTAVREATANVSSQAGGYAVIPVNPPFYSGSGLADNAAVTITGVTLQAVIVEPPTYPTTSGSSADYGELTVKFSESL